METIWMIQEARAIGNWWLATSSWQCAHSCITSHAGFLAKHPITQVTQPCYRPDLAPCDFWLFLKLKSSLKGKRFQTIHEIWENMMGQNCERSQGAYFEGDWGVIVLCTMFLVSCTFFNKCLYFSYYMAGYLLARPFIFLCGCWNQSPALQLSVFLL